MRLWCCVVLGAAACGGGGTPPTTADGAISPDAATSTDAPTSIDADPNVLSVMIVSPPDKWFGRKAWTDVWFHGPVTSAKVDIGGLIQPISPSQIHTDQMSTVYWNTSTAGEGPLTVIVRAYSADGQIAEDTLDLMVDHTQPAIVSITTSRPDTPHDLL